MGVFWQTLDTVQPCFSGDRIGVAGVVKGGVGNPGVEMLGHLESVLDPTQAQDDGLTDSDRN